jgi:hypothetical protein
MKIWGLQFVTNIVLVAIAWWWLTWPDAHTWQVLLSFIVAAIVATAWLMLQCSTFAYFRTTIDAPFMRRLRVLAAFALVMLIFALGLWFLEGVHDDAPRLGTRFAQILHASPRTMIAIIEWKMRALEFIWACVCVALLSTTAALGFSAFRSLRAGFAPLKSVGYWIGMLLAVLGGIYLPWKLAKWVPKAETLPSQAASMGVRFLIAYILLITAIVVMAWLAARPKETTAESAATGD